MLLHSPEQAPTVAVHTDSNLAGKVWACTTIYVGGADFRQPHLIIIFLYVRFMAMITTLLTHRYRN